MRLTAPPAAETGRRDAEGMAVASFVTGLAGLLVLNLILGPTAIVLAVLALRRGTPPPLPRLARAGAGRGRPGGAGGADAGSGDDAVDGVGRVRPCPAVLRNSRA